MEQDNKTKNELMSGNTLVINKRGGYWILKTDEVSGDTKVYSQ